MLNKRFRLRKNKDFRKTYKSSRPISNKYLVLYFRQNNLDESRIGFSISKKIGKANERNYLKRQLREIIRNKLFKIKPGYDLIFIARQGIKEIEFKELEKNLNNLLLKGKLLKC